MTEPMDLTQTIKHLNALRARQSKESRVFGIISNLIEQLDSLRKETDRDARARLEKLAAISVALIDELMRKGDSK